MSAMWIIYLAELGGDINVVCCFALFLCAFAAAGIIFASFVQEEWNQGFIYLKKYILWPFIIFGSIGILIPERNTIYLMVGAKVTEDIVKSPEAKEIGGKILNIINSKLDEQMKEKK